MERKQVNMATKIRPEISENNEYYISKEKYYELKHFCLQYNEWREELKYLTVPLTNDISDLKVDNNILYRTTEEAVIRRSELIKKMCLVSETAGQTDAILGNYIFLVVTGAATFDYIRNYMKVPVSRAEFYRKYRKFFWLLSKRR